MRLSERTRTEICIAPRIGRTGSLGGHAEEFSREMICLRGCVLPMDGGLDAGEKGLRSGKRIRLLVPADTRVQAGDGAWVDGKEYLVRDVRCWTAHLELDCEARA